MPAWVLKEENLHMRSDEYQNLILQKLFMLNWTEHEISTDHLN